MTMADKIVVMRDGRIEQIGAPLELYDRPANTFVAQFIGSPSMNLVQGVVSGEEQPVLTTEDGLQLPMPPSARAWIGRSVKLGIRPEHFYLDPQGVAMRVHVVEPTGAETHVLLRAGNTELVAVFKQRFMAKPGETVHLTPDLALAHVFDVKTELRLSV
jgi:multiple sugar transport system ATP-binding protein